MAYEALSKEDLYFNADEIKLLRSCVGKEVVTIGGMALSDNGVAVAYISLEFNDGSLLTISNEYADMPYFPGEGDEQYMEEAGNFRLSTDKVSRNVPSWEKYSITGDNLPVSPVVRRTYIINQSLAYHDATLENNVHSFTHTSGIILMFQDDNKQNPRSPQYMIIQQAANYSDMIYWNISDSTERHINASMGEWNEPDLYSTSLIRVG